MINLFVILIVIVIFSAYETCFDETPYLNKVAIIVAIVCIVIMSTIGKITGDMNLLILSLSGIGLGFIPLLMEMLFQSFPSFEKLAHSYSRQITEDNSYYCSEEELRFYAEIKYEKTVNVFVFTSFSFLLSLPHMILISFLV